MGCDVNTSCNTCRLDYYLGYGSYSRSKEIMKRFPYGDHQGHDLYEGYSTDWCFEKDGNLYISGGGFVDDTLAIEGYADYKFITYQPGPETYNLNSDNFEKLYNEFGNDADEWYEGYRILQADPSLKEEYKKHELYGKWVRKDA